MFRLFWKPEFCVAEDMLCPRLGEWGQSRDRALVTQVCLKCLRSVAVALEEEVAELRWVKSHRHSSTNIILVSSVNEETEMDLLPHNEEGRGTSLPCKHSFSGWQAETCPSSTPHPTCSSAFFATTPQNPSCALGITPQSSADGLPCPALCWGPKNHQEAAQHLEL